MRSNSVQFLTRLGRTHTDFPLNDLQIQLLDLVLKTLPQKAKIAELVEALAGCEQLTTFRTALQETCDQGRYAEVFDELGSYAPRL